MQYWLLKSEPETFGIDALMKRPKQIEHWDGVRNYQARNSLRDEIKKGDLAFFYHSSTTPPGIAGIIEIVREGYPDFTAWEKDSDHYDADSTPENPRWYMVDVKFVKKFKKFIPLTAIKNNSKLKNMIILRKGNRLSITKLTKAEWDAIIDMEKKL